jgi:hypothetical protein
MMLDDTASPHKKILQTLFQLSSKIAHGIPIPFLVEETFATLPHPHPRDDDYDVMFLHPKLDEIIAAIKLVTDLQCSIEREQKCVWERREVEQCEMRKAIDVIMRLLLKKVQILAKQEYLRVRLEKWVKVLLVTDEFRVAYLRATSALPADIQRKIWQQSEHETSDRMHRLLQPLSLVCIDLTGSL